MVTDAELNDWADRLAESWQSHSAKPVTALSGVSLVDAYRVQQKLVGRRGSPISGYKGALTNDAAQASQGAVEPMLGVLFESVRLENGAAINGSDYTTGLIETEVGFVVGQDIAHSLEMDVFKQHLSHWTPMIEFCDVGFGARPALADLVAGNAAAAYYLQSTFSHPAATANSAQVEFSFETNISHCAVATDALGDQYTSAKWIVDKALSLGYPVKKGHVLMTGSLGRPAPMKPGRYQADYGVFGSITFTIG